MSIMREFLRRPRLTGAILRQLTPRARLVAVELNRVFADRPAQRYRDFRSAPSEFLHWSTP
ncbi:hypothetical protein [Streptomyces sp. LUP30]|uniref:hypothetical protein n=1 Tax=Streptomyces sp. LUP30 TaxID=1890285 RepID=UPI00114D0C78|nr:hypothetical protein [Streptomyces sp. LUP30]